MHHRPFTTTGGRWNSGVKRNAPASSRAVMWREIGCLFSSNVLQDLVWSCSLVEVPEGDTRYLLIKLWYYYCLIVNIFNVHRTEKLGGTVFVCALRVIGLTWISV